MHGVRIYKAHNCMVFTARVIKLAGVKLDKPFYKYDIPDIDKLLTEYPHKEGYLKRIDSADYAKYTDKSDFPTASKEFFHVISTLTKRVLFDRKKIEKEEF